MNSNITEKYHFAESNKITQEFDPALCYDKMIESITFAKNSVYFAGYCFKPGALFSRFEDALIDAAQRGVDVYILADHHGSNSITKVTIDKLKKAEVVWVYYRPLDLMNLPFYDFRLHKKLLIIDNTTAFTGGLGIDDSWIMGSNKYPKPWSDTHFKIEGEIVNDMQRSFLSSWNAFCPKEKILPLKKEGTHINGVPISPIESPTSLTGTRAGKLYLDMIDAANDSIYATTAYFGPPKILRLSLQKAANRGVRVNLMVNGKYNTHHYAAEAGRRWYKSLVSAGVHIYEYQPTKIHSKLMTVDSRFTSIGSANLNFRSFYTDAEYNLLVDDPRLSKQIIKSFNDNLKQCEEITMKNIDEVSLSRKIYRYGASLARFLY